MDVVVTREADGLVTCIRLNRPDSFNAFTRRMLADLVDELAAAYQSNDVRAVVITGEGRAFSAGQDLGELTEEKDLPHGGNDTRLRDGYAPLASSLANAPIPVVAAVNGIAAGAGLSLAALCAARVLSSRASFVPAFIELGLVPDTAATATVPALIGPERAARWFVDGRRLPADEALVWGLADAVVEPERVVETAIGMAVRMGGRDPHAVEATRRLVRLGGAADLETTLRAETNEQVLATSRDPFRAELIRMSRTSAS